MQPLRLFLAWWPAVCTCLQGLQFVGYDAIIRHNKGLQSLAGERPGAAFLTAAS
jgi:hypothetical protein